MSNFAKVALYKKGGFSSDDIGCIVELDKLYVAANYPDNNGRHNRFTISMIGTDEGRVYCGPDLARICSGPREGRLVRCIRDEKGRLVSPRLGEVIKPAGIYKDVGLYERYPEARLALNPERDKNPWRTYQKLIGLPWDDIPAERGQFQLPLFVTWGSHLVVRETEALKMAALQLITTGGWRIPGVPEAPNDGIVQKVDDNTVEFNGKQFSWDIAEVRKEFEVYGFSRVTIPRLLPREGIVNEGESLFIPLGTKNMSINELIDMTIWPFIKTATVLSELVAGFEHAGHVAYDVDYVIGTEFGMYIPDSVVDGVLPIKWEGRPSEMKVISDGTYVDLYNHPYAVGARRRMRERRQQRMAV